MQAGTPTGLDNATGAPRKRKWDVPAPAAEGRKRKWDVPGPQAPVSGGVPVDAATIARAQQGAAAVLQKINQDMAAKGILPPSIKPAPPPVPQEDPNPIQEVVINDAESNIRIQLTKRSTQDEILRKFGCVAITRGRYRPPNMPDSEEKPLHLAIQAAQNITDLDSKKKAIAEAAEYVQSKIRAANLRQNQPYSGSYNAVPAPGQTQQPAHTGTLSVYVGFTADATFDIPGRLRGPNDSYFGHIFSETGASAQLRGLGSGTAESPEPLHVSLSCANPRGLEDARRLVENLVQTVKSDFMRSIPQTDYSNHSSHFPPAQQAQYPQQQPMYQGGYQGLPPPPDLAAMSPSAYGIPSPPAGHPLRPPGPAVIPFSAGPPPPVPGGMPQQNSWNPQTGQQPLYAPPPGGYPVHPPYAPPSPQQLYAPTGQQHPPDPASNSGQHAIAGIPQPSRAAPEPAATPPGRRRRFRETTAQVSEVGTTGSEQATSASSSHSSRNDLIGPSIGDDSPGPRAPDAPGAQARGGALRRGPPGSGPAPATKPAPLPAAEARRLMPPPPPRPKRTVAGAAVDHSTGSAHSSSQPRAFEVSSSLQQGNGHLPPDTTQADATLPAGLGSLISIDYGSDEDECS
ncbi:hypothetical protein CYMTET_39861 [Cymbomonas tetramitiformis]|uniref:Uncharacterized protein n=1 Tax=Cymbomonas tetramitiformis TaxID=36881 RepID=A0AAE0C9A8_9CHLO|nr:hypothetical protein CYMTET_39861 [Cymbomonas tetramitiformis]